MNFKYSQKIVTIFCLSLLFLNLLPNQAFSESIKNNERKFSLHTGSFIYHFYGQSKNDYTEHFENKFIAGDIKINDSSRLMAGTFINSYGSRCFLLGLEKNWHDFNSKLSFEGSYSYAGEFFFEPFSHCGDSGGIYKKIGNNTGLEFSPYIYHGLEYDLAPMVSLEVGILLPAIFISSIQWKF